MDIKEELSETKVDLFKILLSIWKNKFIFLAITLISLSIAFYLIKSLTPSYGYKIYYNLNIINHDDYSENCHFRNVASCRINLAVNRLHLNYLPVERYNEYEINHESIIYKGSSKDDLEITYKLVKSANKKLTEDLKKLSYSLKNYVSGKELEYIEKNLFLMDNDNLIFSFSEPTIIEYPKLSNFIILFLLLFGPVLSLVIIFIKENINNYN